MTGIVQFVRKKVSYNVFVKHIRGMSQVFQQIYCREVTRARLGHITENKIFQRMIFRCTLPYRSEDCTVCLANRTESSTYFSTRRGSTPASTIFLIGQIFHDRQAGSQLYDQLQAWRTYITTYPENCMHDHALTSQTLSPQQRIIYYKRESTAYDSNFQLQHLNFIVDLKILHSSFRIYSLENVFTLVFQLLNSTFLYDLARRTFQLAQTNYATMQFSTGRTYFHTQLLFITFDT